MPFLGTLPPSSGVIREKGAGVGTISQFPAGKIPATHLPCDGAQFDRNIFGELYEFLKNDRTPLIQPDYRVGDVKWFPKRSHIHPDFVPADGQLLNLADYPEVKILFDHGSVWGALEAAFTGDPLNRGSWVYDLPDAFRVPDMNGKTENTRGALFIRGDGVNSSGGGLIQDDAIRNITGQLNLHASEVANIIGGMSGVMKPFYTHIGSYRTPADLTLHNDPSVNSYGGFEIDASRVVPTAEENRPLNLAGCWAVRVKMSTVFAIKTSGSVENEGYLDVAGLVQSNNELRQRIEELMPQSGSNNKGTWVKFPDGTMIISIGFTRSEGSIQTKTLEFPESFADYPVPAFATGDQNSVICNVESITPKSITISGRNANGIDKTLPYFTYITLTGRWK